MIKLSILDCADDSLSKVNYNETDNNQESDCRNGTSDSEQGDRKAVQLTVGVVPCERVKENVALIGYAASQTTGKP
jgi:hypothetical protein